MILSVCMRFHLCFGVQKELIRSQKLVNIFHDMVCDIFSQYSDIGHTLNEMRLVGKHRDKMTDVVFVPNDIPRVDKMYESTTFNRHGKRVIRKDIFAHHTEKVIPIHIGSSTSSSGVLNLLNSLDELTRPLRMTPNRVVKQSC